jgi:hypothetical protein
MTVKAKNKSLTKPEIAQLALDQTRTDHLAETLESVVRLYVKNPPTDQTPTYRLMIALSAAEQLRDNLVEALQTSRDFDNMLPSDVAR